LRPKDNWRRKTTTENEFSEEVVLKSAYFATLAFLALCLHAAPAMAYVGPGLGTGAIAAVLGIFAGIFMLIVAVVWYPIKRLIKRKRTKEQ
jgi:hypothetical protein